MADNSNFGVESSAVQTHLTIMQGVIQRMAENSRSCKVLCVTLVAAILVFMARTGEPKHVLIALVPTVLLYLLDVYYLVLERRFRKSYKAFVEKVHAGEVRALDLYAVTPEGPTTPELLWSMLRSFSVLPLYSLMAVTVVLASCWLGN